MSAEAGKFEIDVSDDVKLARDSLLYHAKYGAMIVDTVSISALGKRARLQSDEREGLLSVELTEEQLREQWGETIVSDPFELGGSGVAYYQKAFSSKDDAVEIELDVSGPEDRAEAIMAYLDDSTIRALQAFEHQQPPDECEGRYEIDWETIFEKVGDVE